MKRPVVPNSRKEMDFSKKGSSDEPSSVYKDVSVFLCVAHVRRLFENISFKTGKMQ